MRSRIFADRIGHLHKACANGAKGIDAELHFNKRIANAGIHFEVSLRTLVWIGIGAHL